MRKNFVLSLSSRSLLETLTPVFPGTSLFRQIFRFPQRPDTRIQNPVFPLNPCITPGSGPRPRQPRVPDRRRCRHRRDHRKSLPLSFFPFLSPPFSFLFFFPFSFSFLFFSLSFPLSLSFLSSLPRAPGPRLSLRPLLRPTVPNRARLPRTRRPWTPLRSRSTPGPAGPPPRRAPPGRAPPAQPAYPDPPRRAAPTPPRCRAHAHARARLATGPCATPPYTLLARPAPPCPARLCPKCHLAGRSTDLHAHAVALARSAGDHGTAPPALAAAPRHLAALWRR